MAQDNSRAVYLAVVSKREIRSYSDDPIPDDALHRLLQAGRATGSAANRQPWRFYVVRNRDVLNQLADTVYEPDNLRGCALAIALVMTRSSGFDAGRAAQNIGLAAWEDGIGTCPNGLSNRDEARRILDLEADWELPTILSVGYPAKPIRQRDNDPETILARINRKPLEELTHWID